MSADNPSASSAVYPGCFTSSSTLSAMTVTNSSTNVRTATKTLTSQRGGKASRGRGSKRHIDVPVSTVPGRSLENPKSDNLVHDVCSSHIALSEQLSSADNITGNVKSEPPPTADENVMELSNTPVAKIAENIEQPVKKHERGKVCIC